MTTQPNETPAAELKALLERFGTELADQPGRVSGLLRDTCGKFRLEIALLVSAAEEGVPAHLLREADHPGSGRIGALARRLEASRGLSERNALWAVESWARALGIPTSSDVPVPAGDGQRLESPSGSPAQPDSKQPASPVAVLSPPPPDSGLDAAGSDGQQVVELPPMDLPRAPDERKDGERPKRRIPLVIGGVAALLVVVAVAIAVPMVGAEDPRPSPSSSVDTGGGPTPPPSGTTGPTSPPPLRVRAPVNLRTLSSTSSRITLIWKRAPNGGQVDHFAVYRDTELIRGHLEERQFTDDDVTPGKLYRYEVVAIGVDRSEATSDTLRVMVPLPTTTPNPQPSNPPPQDEGCPPGWLPLPSGECIPPD